MWLALMKFVAHPEEIPLHIEEVENLDTSDELLEVNGFVGISYLTPTPYQLGQSIRLKLADIDPQFNVIGYIFQCEKEQHGYRIFIAFPNKEDCYYVRMIEQLSHIEHYRRQARLQGRQLNFNEAATEWIQMFAASFPELAC